MIRDRPKVFSYFAHPEFGVEFAVEEQPSGPPLTRLESQVDDIEILQSREHTDSYAVGIRDRIPRGNVTCLDLSDRCGQTRS